jgi:hypothetical protein
MRNKLVLALTALVAVLMVSSIALSGGQPPIPALSFEELGSGHMVLGYRIPCSHYDQSYSALILGANRIGHGDIYVLVTESLDFDVKVSLYTMVDHLNNELRSFGVDSVSSVIGSDSLPKVFSDPQAILICGPSTSLPDYFAAPALHWVERGGLWIGVGESSVPFMYSQSNESNPNATMRLDFTELSYNGGVDGRPTPMATALGFRYVAPDNAFELQDLEALGGRSIGFEYDRDGLLGTAGVIHIGKGSVMVMGGDMGPPPLSTSEEVLAWDLEKVLAFNVPWWTGELTYQIVSSDGSAIESALNSSFTYNGLYASYGVVPRNDAVQSCAVGHYSR